jgi:hypothetical protein
MRVIYAFVGVLIGALIDLAINLLAAAIQQRPFGAQLGRQGMGWLIGLIVAGLLLGVWLGATVRLQPRANTAAPTLPTHRRAVQPMTLTRLRALMSYGRLRGQGIALADILLIGSVLDIDTRE